METKPTAQRILAFFTMAVCAALIMLSLTACSAEEANTESTDATATESTETEATAEEVTDSFTAHGSSYSKAETVSVNTTLTGNLTDISVTEWLKNPEGLATITDESTLQAIAADSENTTFTQDGTTLTWTTNGEDVTYTGTTNQELPFDISYTYKLDGQEVDPATLTNVTGALEVTISYTNKTSGTITVNGSSKSIQQPYAMASLISFDSEHAKNVTVDNGTVMDQDGSFIAVGMGMPGLAKSLDLDGTLDLPESVTITADVTGFEMPSITTMATNQVLGGVSDETLNDASSSIDDIFSQVSQIQTAMDTLSQGTSAINQALTTISEGQAKLNAAFPNATDGLTALQTVSGGVTTAVDSANESVGASTASQSETLTSLQSLLESEALSEGDRATVEAAIASLEAAQQSNATATAALAQASTASSQLTQGIGSVAEGLSQIQSGYEQLSTALTQVNQATEQLSAGTATMSENISSALSSAEGSIYGMLDQVEALADYAKAEGAFCGNASDMEASTTFIVTAKND